MLLQHDKKCTLLKAKDSNLKYRGTYSMACKFSMQNY